MVRAPLALALARLEVKTLISVASWAAVVDAAEAPALTLMLVVSDAVRVADSAATEADRRAPTFSSAVGAEAVADAAPEKLIVVVSPLFATAEALAEAASCAATPPGLLSKRSMT